MVAERPPADAARRVLWLTPDKPNDISVGRERIASHLEASGFNVTLRGTTLRTLRRSLGERGCYDVVVGTTRAGAIAGTLVSWVHGIPLVVDHIDPIRQLRETSNATLARLVGWLEVVAFRRAVHVLYVYDEETNRVRRHARAATKTALGVDADHFANPDPSALERAREQLAECGENVCIYVGGLEPIYNVSSLLDAMDHLEDWTLIILGTGSLAGEVRSAAADSERVTYLGTVPHTDVPGYLAQADVGMSLVNDPHTLKVLEYFAAGLPVVQVAGRAESRFGDLATYTDLRPSSIATAVRDAGAGSTGTARRRFAREYDWQEIAGTYASVLEGVCG